MDLNTFALSTKGADVLEEMDNFAYVGTTETPSIRSNQENRSVGMLSIMPILLGLLIIAANITAISTILKF